ncbi:hypothetical protein B7463_g2246, partial [Scytalidium lignicola]
MNLYRLSDKIGRSLAVEELDLSFGVSAPIGACVKSIESELLQLKDSLLLDGPFRSMLLIHYHNIEIFLYEIALNENVNTIKYGTYPFIRLNMLLACLNSTKCFFDAWYSLPASVYLNSPYTTWAQIGHALMTLSKLSLFIGEGWDRDYVRSIIDFSSTVDALILQIKEINRLCQQHQPDQLLSRSVPEIFIDLASKLQLMKEFNERRRAAQCNHQDGALRSPLLNESSLLAFPDVDFLTPGSVLFQYLDDEFWHHFT